MRIADYRDQTKTLFALVNDFQACMDEYERGLWAARARTTLTGVAASKDCPRKTGHDAELRQLAITQCEQLLINNLSTSSIPSAPVVSTKTSSGLTKAAKYNKSPSRAVRLARAARSAMRRGYF